MADDGYTPRMKVRYREELLPKLQHELGLTNPMEVPRFEKVVVNMGVGDALKDARLLDASRKSFAKNAGDLRGHVDPDRSTIALPGGTRRAAAASPSPMAVPASG